MHCTMHKLCTSHLLCVAVQVTPFSRWERELPKLVGDSRYKAIDKPKERRQIFDDFCRNVAEEQARSKERKGQQAADAEAAFLALLDEAQAGQQEDEEAAGLHMPCPSRHTASMLAGYALLFEILEPSGLASRASSLSMLHRT